MAEDAATTALHDSNTGAPDPNVRRDQPAQTEAASGLPRRVPNASGINQVTATATAASSPAATASSPAATAPSAGFTAPAGTVRGAAGDASAEHGGAQPSPGGPYPYEPGLTPEVALLGTVLHTPGTLDDLESFLGARDFATPDTQAIYTALRGLRRDRALINVPSMKSDAARLQAANENYVKLITALTASPPPYGRHTIANVPRLIGQLVSAAPASSVPYSGVYDRGAQMRLGRMVLEDSIRRQLRSMGARMTRATPLVAPAEKLSTQRGERSAQALVTNLEVIGSQVDTLSARLAAAVQRTEPGAALWQPPPTPAPAAARRWRMPEQLRAIATPIQHRAERHIIHLALHAGRMNSVPHEILSLAPEHFSSVAHANTWRTIQDLRLCGDPANYIAVHREASAAHFVHHPILSAAALNRMALPPEIKPGRIAGSLRTLVVSALSRARADARGGIATATADAVPVTRALAEVKQNVTGLATKARTAVDQHQEINRQQHQARHGSRR